MAALQRFPDVLRRSAASRAGGAASRAGGALSLRRYMAPFLWAGAVVAPALLLAPAAGHAGPPGAPSAAPSASVPSSAPPSTPSARSTPGATSASAAPATSPAPSGAPAASGSAAPSPLLAARALYNVGREHIEKKQWNEAYAALEAAFGFKPHWQTAMMLGWAEMEVGKVRSAIRHLTMAATEAAADPNPSADVKAQATSKIASLLQEAKERLPHLRVKGTPPGASVTIDAEPAGTAPLAGPVEADPGEHIVTAELHGRKISQRVTVPARLKNQPSMPVEVELVWPPSPAPSTAASASTGGPDGAGRGAAGTDGGAGGSQPLLSGVMVALAVGAGTATLAGLGVFIGSEVKGGEAIAARDAYLALPPQQQTTVEKQKVGDLLREQDSLLTGAVVAWVTAVVMGGGAAGVYLYQSRSSKAARAPGVYPHQSRSSKAAHAPAPAGATVRGRPWASPNGAGVVFQGSF